jgi:hypothetical protein
MLVRVNKYNKLFEIEKLENNDWRKIGSLPANGNSNTYRTYNFSDITAINGKNIYRLKIADTDGSHKYSDALEILFEKELEFELKQNYPNPFNPTTSISYQVPNAEFVTIKIYNILGKEIMTLVNEVKQPGMYMVEFDAKDLTSGVYLYEIKTNNFRFIRKMILIK